MRNGVTQFVRSLHHPCSPSTSLRYGGWLLLGLRLLTIALPIEVRLLRLLTHSYLLLNAVGTIITHITPLVQLIPPDETPYPVTDPTYSCTQSTLPSPTLHLSFSSYLPTRLDGWSTSPLTFYPCQCMDISLHETPIHLSVTTWVESYAGTCMSMYRRMQVQSTGPWPNALAHLTILTHVYIQRCIGYAERWYKQYTIPMRHKKAGINKGLKRSMKNHSFF